MNSVQIAEIFYEAGVEYADNRVPEQMLRDRATLVELNNVAIRMYDKLWTESSEEWSPDEYRGDALNAFHAGYAKRIVAINPLVNQCPKCKSSHLSREEMRQSDGSWYWKWSCYKCRHYEYD